MSREAERELEAIRAKMARGELDPGVWEKLGDFWGAAPNLTGGDTAAEFVEKRRVTWDEVFRAAADVADRTPDLPPGFDLGEVVE